MAQPTPTTSRSSTTVLVVAVAVMFCFSVACVGAIAIAAPEGSNPGALATILFAALAATIPAVVAVAQLAQVRRQVNDLSNGVMDSKIRAGVGDMLHDDFLDPDAAEQLAEDRVVRDRNGGHAPRSSPGNPR